MLKGEMLQPCIDFRGWNNFTVQNRYSLPLNYSAFDLLQGATTVAKLDLRNTYISFGWDPGIPEYYLVMPFGLTLALPVFQTLVSDPL